MNSIDNIQINDYDAGIEDIESGVTFVKSDGEILQIQEGQMENKFFLSQADNYYLQNNTEEKKPKNVFVVCMKDNYKQMNYEMLYEKIVDTEAFMEICKETTILKAPYSMMYNYNLKSMAKYVDGDFLNKIYNTKFNFNNAEIVIIMFELTENMAKLNNSLYNCYTDINDLLPMVELMYHYNKSYKKPVMKQFTKYLENVSCSQYWSNEENGQLLNMTEIFNSRAFDYKLKKLETFKKSLEKMTKNEQEHVKNIMTEKNNNENKKCNFDYLHGLNNVANEQKQQVKPQEQQQGEQQEEQQEQSHEQQIINKLKGPSGTTEFSDIYTAIKKNNKRTYYINNNHEISKEYLVKVFDFLTEDEELFHMTNMLMLSKDLCYHLFATEIYNKIKPVIEKHRAFYRYLFGYTWTALFVNESIMKTKTTKADNYVFDIETVSKLPYFPLSHDNIMQNPYVVLTVDSKDLNVKKNVMSLPHPLNGENYFGVCNLEQFKYRMNLFMSGKSNVFPLQDINWDNFAISGSIIPACLQKKSLLFDLVTNAQQTEDEKWKTFFNHYYDESDIDLICRSTSTLDYLEKVESVIASLDKHLGEKTTQIATTKSMATFVTKSFFTERCAYFNERCGTNYTPEQMCGLLNPTETNELHEYLYEIYITHKIKNNDKLRKETKNKPSTLLKYLMEPNSTKELNINVANYVMTKQTSMAEDNEMCFYVNDFRDENNKVEEEKNIVLLKFSENLKFKISNQNLAHPIELFKTNANDFFGIVGRFHFPCVRGFYQNNNVFMLPSCVSAMMTGINIDYKYFAGSRDPVDIINKYRMRGFSTLLSKKELEHFVEYNKVVKTFNGIFNEENEEQLVGTKNLNDKIFKLKHYKDGFPLDIYNSEQRQCIVTENDVAKYYEQKCNYKQSQNINILNINFIDTKGNVQKYDNYANTYWNSNKTN